MTFWKATRRISFSDCFVGRSLETVRLSDPFVSVMALLPAIQEKTFIFLKWRAGSLTYIRLYRVLATIPVFFIVKK